SRSRRGGPDLHGDHGVSPSIAHGECQKREQPLVGPTRAITPCATDNSLFCLRPSDRKMKPCLRIFSLPHWLPSAHVDCSNGSLADATLRCAAPLGAGAQATGCDDPL